MVKSFSVCTSTQAWRFAIFHSLKQREAVLKVVAEECNNGFEERVWFKLNVLEFKFQIVHHWFRPLLQGTARFFSRFLGSSFVMNDIGFINAWHGEYTFQAIKRKNKWNYRNRELTALWTVCAVAQWFSCRLASTPDLSKQYTRELQKGKLGSDQTRIDPPTNSTRAWRTRTESTSRSDTQHRELQFKSPS